MSLSEAQVRRYSRHILLPDVGGRGQQRLLDGAVSVAVGPGLISELVALTYLAAAGVGTIVVTGEVNGRPSPAELRLGIVYGVADGARSRFESIRARLQALNPDVTVTMDAAAGALPVSVEPGAETLADALIAGGLAASRTLHALLQGPA